MKNLSPFLVAVLLAGGALADTSPPVNSRPGQTTPQVTNIQGCNGTPGCIPVPITGTINSAGAADTVGPDATFNANAICATVATAGQLGAGFFLASGTLAATLTPAISADATPTGASCTGGNYTTTKFVDVNQNTASTLVVTNPNGFQNVWIQGMPSTRCARVCTTSFTSGSALGHLTATTLQPPPPAAGADVTDRPARQLGKVYGSDGNPIATANTGRVQVDIITGAGGGGDTAANAAASETATTRGASTSALRVLDTAQTAGSQLVTLQGTASNGARVDVKASALPTGASTEATLAAIKTKTDNLDVLLSTRTKPADSQTVAGTVTSNIGTTGGLALDATLTGGTTKVITRGGAKGATTAADVTSTAEGADHQAIDVTLWLSGSALDPRTRSWTLSSGTDSINVGNFPATYDISDRAARLLGIIYGSQNQQLKQSASNFNTVVELAVGSGLIDPRAIRALTASDIVDISDRTARLLGHIVCDSGCGGAASFADLGTFTGGSSTVNISAGEFDDTPLADVATGKAAAVRITKQRAQHANLRDANGTEIGTSGAPIRTDPTGSTIQPVNGTVTANIGTSGSLALDATLTGGSAKEIVRGGAKGTTTAADITSTASGLNHQGLDTILYDTSGNALDPRTRTWTLSNGTDSVTVSGSVSVSNFPATYDTSDRAGRLLGVTYGSQAQQIKQTATNFNLATELFVGGSAVDPRTRTWNLGASDVPDLSDRAARLLGHTVTDTGSVTNATIAADSVGLATSANQTNGTGKVQRVDNSGNVAPAGDASTRPVHVTLDSTTVTTSNAPDTGNVILSSTVLSELIQQRQLMEQILIELRSHSIALQTLKDAGPPSPSGVSSTSLTQ